MKKILLLIVSLVFCTGFTLHKQDGFSLELVEESEINLTNNNVSKEFKMTASLVNSTDKDFCFDVVVTAVEAIYITTYEGKNIKVSANSELELRKGIMQLVSMKEGVNKINGTDSRFSVVNCKAE